MPPAACSAIPSLSLAFCSLQGKAQGKELRELCEIMSEQVERMRAVCQVRRRGAWWSRQWVVVVGGCAGGLLRVPGASGCTHARAHASCVRKTWTRGFGVTCVCVALMPWHGLDLTFEAFESMGDHVRSRAAAGCHLTHCGPPA